MARTLAAGAVAVLALAVPLTAQCGAEALPGTAIPGPATGKVHAAVAWDPDGTGPLPHRLVLGGDFAIPAIGASHMASFDFATRTWHPMPGISSGPVYDLVVTQQGELVAVGGFVAPGNATVGVARWDGAAWQPMGNGLGGSGHAIVVMRNGDLVAGGATVGGATTLWRWDGTLWSPLGGHVDGPVNCLDVAPNGDLFVGGNFVFVGGVFVGRVARWDGAAWHSLGSIGGGGAASLAVLPNGDLVVSGQFLIAGTTAVNRVARWDGTTWWPLADGTQLPFSAMQVLPNGDLVAAGLFTPPGQPPFNLGRWDGLQWTQVGSGTTRPALDLCLLPDGRLVAAGDFDLCDGIAVGMVAVHDGSRWSALGEAPDNRVLAVAADAVGDLHVGGSFRIAGGRLVASLGRIRTGTWERPPVAGNTFYAPVETIVRLSDGRLAATGFGGLSQRGIALWDGTAWQPTALTLNHDVHAIAEAADGSIVVGGSFNLAPGFPSVRRVARLVGNAWQPVGSQYHGDPVRALLTLPDGGIVAGGDFARVDGVLVNHVSRWDGSAWVAMGAGLGTFGDTVRCLVRLPGGDLVAGGRFALAGTTVVNHIARWSGTAWQPLGTGLAGGRGPTSVHAMLVLPGGDLLVGGDFATAGGVAARGLARWDGTAWRAFQLAVDGAVHALHLQPDGDLWIGGEFATVGGIVSGNLARVRSLCAAGAAIVGAGCTNSLGPVRLVPRELPWLGATYRATCDQVPTGALGFAVRGLQPAAVPLAVYHPAAGSDCVQHVAMDAVTWLFPVGNRVESALAIPRSVALLGARLRDQVVVAELGPGLAIVELSSSDALLLTVGAWN